MSQRKNHKHVYLIRAIFQNPISGNIHWREIESLLHHLGASVEPIQGERFRVLLTGEIFVSARRNPQAQGGCRQDRGHAEENWLRSV